MPSHTGRPRSWSFKGTMLRALPEEIYRVMDRRLNEVMDGLIESSQMIDRGDDEFKNWCKILILDCARFHLGEWEIKEPRHPKGLIAELKKQHKKLHHVRSGLTNLPRQYALPIGLNRFNFESLAEFGNSPVEIFENSFTGVHDLLAHASVVLSMNIAQIVRETPNDRRMAPKTTFSDGMIYLFQRANFGNEIVSSPTSSFADFFSLSYYVATGEEGVFLERPVKTAIANIRWEDGQILHPYLCLSFASEKTRAEIKDLWPDRFQEMKQIEASFASEDIDEGSVDTSSRIQIQDAKWVLMNIPTSPNLDGYIIHKLIEAGLRALKYPTNEERQEITEYNLIRERTLPPLDFE